jgi:hypothetical protein
MRASTWDSVCQVGACLRFATNSSARVGYSGRMPSRECERSSPPEPAAPRFCIVADGAATDWVLLHGSLRPKQQLTAQGLGCRRGRWFVNAAALDVRLA